ncbi:MAG TPA: sporulation integral membrane protein YtvI [Tepidanaerobacteraceae bacterium]|nr:sporulation integral membrane protein YtvI [Tepidanaerobacteraceae bacterium]
MKMRTTYSPIFFLVLAVAVTAIVIVLAIKYFLPLVIGIFIAILIDPIVTYLERKLELDRGIITVIVLSAIFCLTGYISLLIIARFTFELARFTNFLPTQLRHFNALIDKSYLYLSNFFAKVPEDIIVYLKANLNQILSTISGSLSNLYTFLVNKIGMVPNLLVNLLVVIIFVFLFSYFLTKDKDKIIHIIKNLFPEQLHEKVKSVQLELVFSFFRLIKAQIILVLISTVITVLGFCILRVEYALTLGIICGILDIMPLFGPSLIFIPWIIYLLVIGNVNFAIGLLFLYVDVIGSRQMFQAKIIGRNLGIDPLLTLLSIYLGVKVFGWKGLFVGPLVVVIVRALIHCGIIPPLNKPTKKV